MYLFQLYFNEKREQVIVYILYQDIDWIYFIAYRIYQPKIESVMLEYQARKEWKDCQEDIGVDIVSLFF